MASSAQLDPVLWQAYSEVSSYIVLISGQLLQDSLFFILNEVFDFNSHIWGTLSSFRSVAVMAF